MVFVDKKILLLTKHLDRTVLGGRELLCKVNHDALRSLYGGHFVLWELRDERLRGVRGAFNGFRGHIDGLSAGIIEAVLLRIREEHIGQVFVDGSNLGEFVAVLKRRIPAIEVITFFHNVEARFFWGSWCLHKTLHALGVLLANALAERKAVKFSDKIICLSERDSGLLKRLYGRGATHIAPMVLEDKCPASFPQSVTYQPERFALFVGGTFYANRVGIEWFVREVVPQIEMPVYIVGRGFEALRVELEVPGKVVVVGAVDSLSDWYRRAYFVIAPIFDGSGMKTKVAEALMYGKKVIGTPEAFSGYEDIAYPMGRVCSTKEEFVIAIRRADDMVREPFDAELRAIYESKYSFAAATARFRAILSAW